MRFLVVAALCAVAASEMLELGYGLGNGDLQFDLTPGTKYGTKIFTLSIPPSAMFNGMANVDNSNWFLSLRFMLSAKDCPQCAAQTIDVNYRFGAQTASNTDPSALSKGGGADLVTSGVWADIPLAWSASTQTVSFLVNVTCSLCSKSAELSRLNAIVRNVDKSMTPNVVVFGSFMRDSDRNTDQFDGPVASWGPVVQVDGIMATDYLMVVQEIKGVASLGAGIVYYFSQNMTSFGSQLAMYDNATWTCASMGSGCSSVGVFNPTGTPKFLRAPAGTYKTGAFPGEATRVGASATGTWYIAPFITTKPTASSTASYVFAIGLNAVPAAAAGLVPSFLVVALATVFAALRV